MKTSALPVLVVATALLAGCGKGADPSGQPGASGSASPTAPTAAAVSGSATKVVDLAPLPLKISLPKDEAGETMDKTMSPKHRSVGVSYDAIGGGLNVSDADEKSFDAVKKQHKGDTVMYPFKRWVKETPTSAVEEFTADGKSGFMALSWKVIGGSTYLCQSAGLSGLKSPADADTALAACDTLAAK